MNILNLVSVMNIPSRSDGHSGNVDHYTVDPYISAVPLERILNEDSGWQEGHQYDNMHFMSIPPTFCITRLYLIHKRRKIFLDNIRNYLKKFVGLIKIENPPEAIMIYNDHTIKLKFETGIGIY